MQIMLCLAITLRYVLTESIKYCAMDICLAIGVAFLQVQNQVSRTFLDVLLHSVVPVGSVQKCCT